MIFSRVKKEQRGQAIVITSIAMAVLLGICALVMDLGVDFRTKRRLQGTSDAAALAGAQELPDSASVAKSVAQTYADKNGGDAESITVTSTYYANDTIEVTAKKTQPGIFSKVLGIDSVDIHARAKARVGPPRAAMHVAPMVVHCNHPLIKNCNNDHEPEFGTGTHLDYDKMGAPGAFGMLNLSGGSGTPGSSEQAEWILYGFDKYLPLGNYKSNPGAKFESAQVSGALDARVGTVLLFPVFRTLTGEGSNAEYEIIGWIGFYLTGWKVHGHTAELEGYFTEYIAKGILASAGPGSSGVPSAFFGVKSIQLIE
jgi:hypothetical protein